MDPFPPRLGYCCMFRAPDADPLQERRFNVSGTTVTALQRMDRLDAFEKVLALVSRNLAVMEAHVRRVATAAPLERLLRLDSNVLPAYTHPVARWMYDEPVMRELVEQGMARIGDAARRGGVRLSLHPGPFCVLASPNPAAVRNGLDELEYHTELMRLLVDEHGVEQRRRLAAEHRRLGRHRCGRAGRGRRGLPGGQRRSTTWSTQAVSASTSAGSIAGNIATRSWLRPSLR